MREADVLTAAVPAELRARPQWVVWRYEQRAGKATKVPYSPATGARASATDSLTWATFSEAVDRWRRDGFDGVGFVFSAGDPYCGVDLDDCLSAEGQLTREAQALVDRLSSYTEVSPSGSGLKLFLRGRLPAGRRRKGKIEMYDRGRYFTVTGWQLAGTPSTVQERQRELEVIQREIFGVVPQDPPRRGFAVPPIADDAELLARARSAKNGRKFMGLYYCGDLSAYGGDDSAADLALCTLLAFWCGPDRERIDRLFRRSALMREKWDSRRGLTTYGGLTTDAVLRSRRG